MNLDNGDLWSCVKNKTPFKHESGIEHGQGPWTTGAMGGDTPILINNGTLSAHDSQTGMAALMGNGAGNNQDPTMGRAVLQGNGTVQNANGWKPGNLIPQKNGVGQSRTSWTPVTPEKVMNERSNTVSFDTKEKESETENWQDLVGMYMGLLQDKNLDTNGVVIDINHTLPPATVDNNGDQNLVTGTTKSNLNQMPSPRPYRYHSSNQASTSLSFFNTEDPANWKCNHLATIVGSKSNSTFVSSSSLSNRLVVQNPPIQVESKQLVTNNVIENGHIPEDRFPVAYQPHYSLSSPPRSEPGATHTMTDSSPMAPITPNNQRKHVDSQQVAENVDFPGGVSTPAKGRHENLTVSIKDAENEYNELLQTTGDSAPSAISKNRDEECIDLNKTPQQKTPLRRKKHRPKVIREGKPKRTRKPKDTTNGTSKETPVKRKYVRKKDATISKTPQKDSESKKTPVGSVGKRKYVRKKGIDRSGSQQQSKVHDVEESVVKATAKSCKKQLNFDLECVAQDESHEIRSSQLDTNGTVDPRDIKQERKIIGILETPAMQDENQYMSLSGLNVPTTHLGKARHHALNVLARNMATNPQQQDRWDNGYNTMNRHVHEQGTRNTFFQAGAVPTNLNRMLPQSFTNDGMVNLDERRGVKRQSSEQMCRNVNAMDSLLLYQKLLLGVAHRAYDRNNLNNVFLENHKKTKIQSITPLENNLRQEARQMGGIYGNGSAMQLLNSSTGRVNPAWKAINVGGNVSNHQFQPPMAATYYLQKHQMSSGMQPHTRGSIPERSQNYTPGSVTAIISWNPPPPTTPNRASIHAIANPDFYNKRFNGLDEMLQQHHRDPPKGQARRQKAEVSVDDVTYMLENLHICDENKKKKNELVLYRDSNTIVPFEPIKKRIPRPKVDLDPETDRIWRLLMGKEGSESDETLDKDKEKWWENERRVFRGRAESFIARMHLVQGDRRFSRWKGSVVDSVIGVFLTQNVSDHLSSSAFMSLAAKFPGKSSTTNKPCAQEGCIEVAEPNGTIKCQEKIRTQQIPDQSFFVSSESSETIIQHISSTTVATKKHQRITEEEVILSQDSFDSSTIQTVDEIRSSSGSNSEAEDATTGFETGPPVNPIPKDKSTMFKDNSCHLPKEPECNMQIPRMSRVDLNSSSDITPANSTNPVSKTSDLQKVELQSFGVLEEESMSSLPSFNNYGMTELYRTSNVVYPQNENPKFQTPSPGQCNLTSSHPVHPKNFQSVPHQQVTKSFTETTEHGAYKQDSSMFEGIPINDNDRISMEDKQICLENTATEANSKEQNASHEPQNGAGTNMSKARKGAAEDERNKAIDWDRLRKEALSSGEKRERSNDAADSLDYEALRHAHVNEISDAIKERGMNNLLADRMKDFLNRLVRDHGKIDLEWLRDAPPDKVKDYLLSFRGLGLKSVECVRLLTLHHLAFPVDTNVGRIAVRLGWVPLQPLPESLQLHLLEMYPMLETIQKYLWPRLCKMDQLTLYELHYQMITFGKVFCTKSKPNCNACPMRAECRHFASAFASARLALPGPEEKRIVTSNAPVTTDPRPSVVVRPMPQLPQAENEFGQNAASFGRNCEPIIEEPTSPEPETTQLSISDIEDQYYDDSDEIPSIKLNMEEFKTNLQNIMQDSMELQEDMSKALVALSPNAASIPTPKLKEVSRLRTEHLVYELPDSHQLLEGLDKREPDDPSPYLLAIWTPGETANSVQPPEVECSTQESGRLCDRTTCFSCNSIKESNSQLVRGTILIPCRTAMRGSFPLNGTYFQVNEMFADHASSLNPIDVPRAWIWNLPRRTVYFGTSVSTIFKGLTTEEIQYCFWKGFVCVRGFEQKTRAPRPLIARLHFPASKLVKTKNEGNK